MQLLETQTADMLKSGVCNQQQLESQPFQEWAQQLGQACGHMHRKIWEWSFITQALYERKLLAPGVSGLGFAVGTEPLASLFCRYGASITATDLFTDMANERGWVETNQHASGFDSLNFRKLCPDELFKQNCSFAHVDMNNIPSDLVNFDFVWSSCSLEHLGSLSHGEEFVLNAMKCLKPGGFAVHTTEYNLSSNTLTIFTGNSVLYRRQDIERIVYTLRKEGHRIDVDFTEGSLPVDACVDIPPYTHNPHLRLQFGDFVTTSIGLIIQKRMQ